MLAAHERVVRDPAERDLGEREAVLLRDGLDRRERAEVRLLPVPRAVVLRAGRGLAASCGGDGPGEEAAAAYLALALVRVEARAGLYGVLEGAVAAGEEATADCTSMRSA